MSIQVRHMYINADWVVRTTQPFGNMPKIMPSQLSRKTLTFKNAVCCSATHPRSSGSAQPTVPVLKSRVCCERLPRSSHGSFRKRKSLVWFWGPNPKPNNPTVRTLSSKSPIAPSYYRARYYDPSVGRFLSEDPLGLRVGVNRFEYVSNTPLNFADPSGLCKISVGHHAIFWLVPTCGPPIPVEHAYIVLGDKDKEERWVFDAQPDGLICPWCKPKLEAAAGPLVAGLAETNQVDSDGTPLLVTEDDGRPCQLDQKIIDAFADKVNAAGVPYRLLSTNSNAAASGALNALGINGWTPPIIVPGWGTPLPIPK
jgi:RHS repeat-associated protein